MKIVIDVIKTNAFYNSANNQQYKKQKNKCI